MRGIAENPGVRCRAQSQGIELTDLTPEQFGTFMAAQMAKWAKVAKASGMRAD
jgi:tripartite-type tricarboxylate transporter receptor subunit TctC